MQTATTNFGLIERAQQGDQRAFELLFEKYRRRLAVLIYYRLGPRLREQVEIDDILQETLLKAFSDIGRFQYQFCRQLLALAVANRRPRRRRSGTLARTAKAPGRRDRPLPFRERRRSGAPRCTQRLAAGLPARDSAGKN